MGRGTEDKREGTEGIEILPSLLRTCHVLPYRFSRFWLHFALRTVAKCIVMTAISSVWRFVPHVIPTLLYNWIPLLHSTQTLYVTTAEEKEKEGRREENGR